MKAIIHRRYGGPDALDVVEIEEPTVGADQVLVHVRASSVNAYDWHMLRGKPYIARVGEGFRRPKSVSMGVDASGVVEAVGDNVTDLQPGDEVYGARNGAFAEYVAGRSFAAKPAGLGFEQAAAVPTAGCTALQAIRDKANVKPGQRVLVIGAGGGVGTFAVQIAKALGAEVTAVTSPTKADLAESIGADRAIDHGRTDLTLGGPQYDAIIDVASDRSLRELGRALGPRATLVLVGPGRGQLIGPVARVVTAAIRSRLGKQTFSPFLAKVTKDDLLALSGMIDSGSIKPVIDRTYPLSEVADAVKYVEDGRARGKVVIAI
jgi:NADPH:quinone reductase-like Zn-dependent oxidoreductase